MEHSLLEVSMHENRANNIGPFRSVCVSHVLSPLAMANHRASLRVSVEDTESSLGKTLTPLVRGSSSLSLTSTQKPRLLKLTAGFSVVLNDDDLYFFFY